MSKSPVDNILKKISALPVDAQEEIFQKLKTVKISNQNAYRLSLVNKDLSKTYSYTARLTAIKESQKSPKNRFDELIKTVGNLKLKNLEDNDEIWHILKDNETNRPKSDKSFDYYMNIQNFRTLEASEKEYKEKTHKNDFTKKVKEYEENLMTYAPHTIIDDIKSDLTTNRINRALQFDGSGNNGLKKINAIKNLSDNVSYKIYVNTLKDAPLGTKLILFKSD